MSTGTTAWIRWGVIVSLIAASAAVVGVRLHRTLTVIEDAVIVSTQRADLRTMQALEVAKDAVGELRELRKDISPVLANTSSLLRETTVAVKSARPIAGKVGVTLDSAANALNVAATLPDRAAAAVSQVKESSALSWDQRQEVTESIVELLKNATAVSRTVAENAPAAVKATTETVKDVSSMTHEIADPKHRPWWHKLIFFWRSGK